MRRILSSLALLTILAVSPSAANGEPKAATERTVAGDHPTDSAELAPPTRPDPRRSYSAGIGQRRRGERERILIRRPDWNRPERSTYLDVFGRPLTLGGRVTARLDYSEDRLLDFDFFSSDDNGNLEDAGKPETDDLLRFATSLQLDLFYPLTENISFYIAGKVSYVNLVRADVAPVFENVVAERGETWLYLGNLFETPFSLQVGRQRVFDVREWWWDDTLDALRLRFDLERVHLEVAASQALAPVTTDDSFIEPEEDDVLRVLGHVSWEWARKQRLGLFALYHDDRSDGPTLVDANGDGRNDLLCLRDFDGDGAPDPDRPFFGTPIFEAGCLDSSREDESDARLLWLGGSAAGRWRLGGPGTLHYWLDAAWVKGDETFYDYSGKSFQRRLGRVLDNPIEGWGASAGITWASKLPARPRLTFTYAYGSGDPRGEQEADRSFRQTGLQDNNGKFRGVDRFRYYGELFDPELSNLHILTAALGFPLLRHSSIEILYHRYRQDEPAPFLRDVSFKRDPDGIHRDLGEEWDAVLGIEEWEHWEIEIIGAIFRTGEAFAPREGRLSYLGIAQVRFNF